MLSAKEAAIIYDTLLSSPGMSDTVKIDLKIPRKTGLLLSHVIEKGLLAKEENGTGILAVADQQSLEQLQAIAGEILQKSGLAEMSQKINSLNAKQ